MTTTTEPATGLPPLFWLLPGSYVTDATPADDETPALYQVTGLRQRGPANATTVDLLNLATGRPGCAQPWQLAPADGPDED